MTLDCGQCHQHLRNGDQPGNFSGAQKWKTLGAKSGLQGGCSMHSKPKVFNSSFVVLTVLRRPKVKWTAAFLQGNTVWGRVDSFTMNMEFSQYDGLLVQKKYLTYNLVCWWLWTSWCLVGGGVFPFHRGMEVQIYPLANSFDEVKSQHDTIWDAAWTSSFCSADNWCGTHHGQTIWNLSHSCKMF